MHSQEPTIVLPAHIVAITCVAKRSQKFKKNGIGHRHYAKECRVQSLLADAGVGDVGRPIEETENHVQEFRNNQSSIHTCWRRYSHGGIVHRHGSAVGMSNMDDPRGIL